MMPAGIRAMVTFLTLGLGAGQYGYMSVLVLGQALRIVLEPYSKLGQALSMQQQLALVRSFNAQTEERHGDGREQATVRELVAGAVDPSLAAVRAQTEDARRVMAVLERFADPSVRPAPVVPTHPVIGLTPRPSPPLHRPSRFPGLGRTYLTKVPADLVAGLTGAGLGMIVDPLKSSVVAAGLIAVYLAYVPGEYIGYKYAEQRMENRLSYDMLPLYRQLRRTIAESSRLTSAEFADAVRNALATVPDDVRGQQEELETYVAGIRSLLGVSGDQDPAHRQLDPGELVGTFVTASPPPSPKPPGWTFPTRDMPAGALQSLVGWLLVGQVKGAAASLVITNLVQSSMFSIAQNVANWNSTKAEMDGWRGQLLQELLARVRSTSAAAGVNQDKMLTVASELEEVLRQHQEQSATAPELLSGLGQVHDAIQGEPDYKRGNPEEYAVPPGVPGDRVRAARERAERIRRQLQGRRPWDAPATTEKIQLLNRYIGVLEHIGELTGPADAEVEAFVRDATGDLPVEFLNLMDAYRSAHVIGRELGELGGTVWSLEESDAELFELLHPVAMASTAVRVDSRTGRWMTGDLAAAFVYYEVVQDTSLAYQRTLLGEVPESGRLPSLDFERIARALRSVPLDGGAIKRRLGGDDLRRLQSVLDEGATLGLYDPQSGQMFAATGLSVTAFLSTLVVHEGHHQLLRARGAEGDRARRAAEENATSLAGFVSLDQREAMEVAALAAEAKFYRAVTQLAQYRMVFDGRAVPAPDRWLAAEDGAQGRHLDPSEVARLDRTQFATVLLALHDWSMRQRADAAELTALNELDREDLERRLIEPFLESMDEVELNEVIQADAALARDLSKAAAELLSATEDVTLTQEEWYSRLEFAGAVLQRAVDLEQVDDLEADTRWRLIEVAAQEPAGNAATLALRQQVLAPVLAQLSLLLLDQDIDVREGLQINRQSDLVTLQNTILQRESDANASTSEYLATRERMINLTNERTQKIAESNDNSDGPSSRDSSDSSGSQGSSEGSGSSVTSGGGERVRARRLKVLAVAVGMVLIAGIVVALRGAPPPPPPDDEDDEEKKKRKKAELTPPPDLDQPRSQPAPSTEPPTQTPGTQANEPEVGLIVRVLRGEKL
jgi:hypothetical protein